MGARRAIVIDIIEAEFCHFRVFHPSHNVFMSTADAATKNKFTVYLPFLNVVSLEKGEKTTSTTLRKSKVIARDENKTCE
jgi:hypothetical protein